MNRLTLCTLIAVSISMAACSEREAEPAATGAVEEAPVAAAAAPAEPAPMSADAPATPPVHTGACEGLTGQALTACLNQAGPTSAPPTTADPATTEPSLTRPDTSEGDVPNGADAPQT